VRKIHKEVMISATLVLPLFMKMSHDAARKGRECANLGSSAGCMIVQVYDGLPVQAGRQSCATKCCGGLTVVLLWAPGSRRLAPSDTATAGL